MLYEVITQVGFNSRLRYMPEAGREFVVVLNHGGSLFPGPLPVGQRDLHDVVERLGEMEGP